MSNASHRPSPFWTGAALMVAFQGFALAAPQEASESSPTQTMAKARNANDKALKRIIHLAGGTTMRAIAREGENGWEYKVKSKWKALPTAAVERIALEKDVLRDMRKRRDDVEKGDVTRTALLAGWMLDEGLLKEGFGTLDQLLTTEPDSKQAIEILHANAYRFRVPMLDPQASVSWESIAPVFKWAMDRGPCSRELATSALGTIDDQDGLEALFAEELFQSSPRRRTFASIALRRLFPGKQLRGLMSRAVLDASENVRREAAFALRSVGDAAVAAPILRVMIKSPHSELRSNAAESLGNMGYAAAVGPMVSRLAAIQSSGSGSVPHSNIFVGRQFAFVQDFDVEVAQFQAIADSSVNVLFEGQTTDAGVLGIKHNLYVRETHSIRASLQKITGERPGGTSKHWVDWWNDRQERQSAGD